MFTGIIQHLGQVKRINKISTGLKLGIDLGPLANQIKPSDSLAVNGVCLTVTAQSKTEAVLDVVSETIKHSTLGQLKTHTRVNLERAIRAGEPFGGHFVQGHVDGIGTIKRLEKKAHESIMEIAVSSELPKLMITKGSIAVDGISLTLVDVRKDRFSVALIPYSLEHTTLGLKTKGQSVNIELDIIGKWVTKLVGQSTKLDSSLQQWLTE